MNKGINLLIDKRSVKTSPLTKRLKAFRLSAIAILFGSSAFAIIINMLIILSPLPQLRQEEQKQLDNLSVYNLEIAKLSFINDRGDNIHKILDQRPSYDKNITAVQEKIPQDVNFDSFSINNKNYTLKFSGKNLESINLLLDSLMAMTGKKKEYIKIYLTSLSVDELSHNFIMIVDLLTV